jgi:hypothetical protein
MLDSGICADANCSTFASVGVGPAKDAYMSLHDHTDFGFRAIMAGSRSGCNASGDDEDEATVYRVPSTTLVTSKVPSKHCREESSSTGSHRTDDRKARHEKTHVR